MAFGTVTFSAPGCDPANSNSPSGKGDCPPGVSPAGVCLNVTALAKRTAIAQKTLSHHLAHLRTAGLVYRQRRGKSVFYEVAEGRVVFRRDAATGGYSLTVTARGGGVSVTIASSAKTAATETPATDGAPGESAPAVSTSAERSGQPSSGDCVA